MPAPKWFVIAKNEYRIRTSNVRRIRLYFPFLVIGILAVYVAYIAPLIVSVFMDELSAFMISQAAVAMVEIILFLVFIYFTIFPITATLREESTGQLEIFLSAPVKPSDILLGQFLGIMPLYAILMTIITGFFTAVLHPLELNIVHITMTIIIFILIFLSAFWTGTVIAALLRTKLIRTARGRDIGRGLAMFFALPLVAMFYAISYGGLLETLADPAASGMVKTLLGWLPSSWGAEVIFTFCSHGGDTTDWLGVIARFGGLVLFFVAVLWLGKKGADRAYSMERTFFIGARAKPDGIFYNTVRHLSGGGVFGTLVVSIFKDYSRRLENISNISYMLGILALMVISIAPQSMGPDEPPVGILVMAEFIFPIIIVMLTGEVTVRGKESLFIYRKAPSGEARFIRALLLKSWLMAFPITGVVTALITWLTMQVTVGSLIVITGLMVVFVAGYTIFVLGLFLLNPAFSEKSMKLWINVMIAMFVAIGLFMASLLILTKGGQVSEPVGGLLLIQGVQSVLSWVVGIIVLHLGKRRLQRIE